MIFETRFLSKSKENLTQLETTEMQRKIAIVGETQNVIRVIYKSGNVFEGPVSDWIPQNKGCICIDGGAIYEVTLSRLYYVNKPAFTYYIMEVLKN